MPYLEEGHGYRSDGRRLKQDIGDIEGARIARAEKRSQSLHSFGIPMTAPMAQVDGAVLQRAASRSRGESLGAAIRKSERELTESREVQHEVARRPPPPQRKMSVDNGFASSVQGQREPQDLFRQKTDMSQAALDDRRLDSAEQAHLTAKGK